MPGSTADFVERWDELIDWNKRAAGEGSFFYDLLRPAGAWRVLDAATGSGFHAAQLHKAGFDVTACDGSPTMVDRARRNFDRLGSTFRSIVATGKRWTPAYWASLTQCCASAARYAICSTARRASPC